MSRIFCTHAASASAVGSTRGRCRRFGLLMISAMWSACSSSTCGKFGVSAFWFTPMWKQFGKPWLHEAVQGLAVPSAQ